MKMSFKEKVWIIVFAAVSVVTLTALGIYYGGWYSTRAGERVLQVAKEQAQKKQEEEAKKEAQAKAEAQERERKRLERIEKAKENVIPAYTEFLNEFQQSGQFDVDADRYFLYDLNRDTIPELVISVPSEESTFLRDYQFYRYGLTSEEVEEIEFSPEVTQTEPVLNFYTGKGIFAYTHDQEGRTHYFRYRLKGGKLVKKDLAEFYLNAETESFQVNGKSVSMDEYITEEENYYTQFLADHIEISDYALTDSTALEAYEKDITLDESEKITDLTDSIAQKNYDGRLLFQPEDILDLGDYYQVVGELWQNVYVPKKEVAGSQVGETLKIKDDYYTITEIGEDGTIYFGNANACLKDNFTGNENYEYYGDIRKKNYEMFRMDNGRPVHYQITSSITLYFSKRAAVIRTGQNYDNTLTHTLSTAEEFLATNYYGDLVNSDSYGYVRVQNGMIYQYVELP